PFAAAAVWLALAGLQPGLTQRERLWWWRDVALAVAATGALVLLLYSPALVVTGAGDLGATSVAQKAASLSEGERASHLFRQRVMAWEQWVYPAPRGVAIATVAVVALGWLVAALRGGFGRWLAIGAVAGPAAVMVVMGGVAPW